MMNIQQKLRMGIPLTPEEQAQMGQPAAPMQRPDPMQQMASLPQGGPLPGSEVNPQDQFTQDELGQLGDLGMYDERQEAIKRKMAMAESLRGRGGPRGGTYGRWNTPTPYSRGEAIVSGLGEAGGAFMQRRAEKEAAAERAAAQKTLGMYEERTRNPRGQAAQNIAKDMAGVKPKQFDLGQDSVWDKIRKAGQRYF